MTTMADIPDEGGEPVCKRTRRSGIVASIGDPTLTDRSKVAPMFLTKKEKVDKQYKKEMEKLTQSTKTRLNDWKSVIGVETDASKVCPVFHKASVVSATLASALVAKPSESAPQVEQPSLLPLSGSGLVPDPYLTPYPVVNCESPLPVRPATVMVDDEAAADYALHQALQLDPPSRVVDLLTPCKPPSPSSPIDQYPDIDKPLQSACIAALTAMALGKHPSQSSAQLTEWTPSNTRDWCAARLEPRKQHALSKWLNKWKDEDTAVRRNRVAPVLLVCGPGGSGKTSLVYAAAAELNIQVLEVSPCGFSWESNGKRPMSEAVKEALQSRQVKNDAAGAASSQIVLIDDIDVLVREDKSVLSSIAAMTFDSKRPLVLTCTDETFITDPDSVLELTQIFRIDRIDHTTSSFLAHVYHQVLSGGSKRLSRAVADMTASHVGGDLGRIALAAQLRWTLDHDEPTHATHLYPRELYSVELDLEKREKLINCLKHGEGLPLALRTDGHDGPTDLLSCVFSTATEHSDVGSWERVMDGLCLADCSGVAPDVAAHLALSSAGNRSCAAGWLEASTGRRANPVNAAEIVAPFLSQRESFYVCSNAYRTGIILHHLGVMARMSNTPAFNSRRVRCVLDTFQAGVSEINQLRILFPPNQ